MERPGEHGAGRRALGGRARPAGAGGSKRAPPSAPRFRDDVNDRRVCRAKGGRPARIQVVPVRPFPKRRRLAMSPCSRRLPALALAALSSTLAAQSKFATQVVSFQQGTGSGVFVQSNILGGPQGAGAGSGSLNVLTLGNAGSVTLGFDVVIRDGPGADFTTFENGFFAG